MCTGFEIAMVGTAVFGALSANKSGKEQKGALDAQSRQAEEDAKSERAASAVRAGLIRRGGKLQRSEARSGFSAAGVDVNSGTPTDVDREIVRSSEEDAMNELLHGARLGTRYAQEAENLRQSGRVARASANRDIVGSVLIGGGQLAKGWKTSRGSGGSGAGGEPLLLATGGETV